MNKQAVDFLLFRLGKAMQICHIMERPDLDYLDHDLISKSAIRNLRNMLGAMIKTEDQATQWIRQARQHLENIQADAGMLIGPRDFAVLRRSCQGWEFENRMPSRYSNWQQGRRSAGEMILSAFLGRVVMQGHCWMNDDWVLAGRHSLEAADATTLRQVSTLMFSLGQYTKGEFEWAQVGSNYSLMVYMIPVVGTVIGAMPMLERGPGKSAFIPRVNHRLYQDMIMDTPEGKELLCMLGMSEKKMPYPVYRMHWMVMNGAPIIRRFRDLSDTLQDTWDPDPLYFPQVQRDAAEETDGAEEALANDDEDDY